jgi:hypothetical protein
MKLTDEERFAVSMLFSGDSEFDHMVRDNLAGAIVIVIEREYTGVGFFSDLSLPFTVPQRDRHARDWNFNHTQLQYGGSIMCTFSNTGILEIEGVAFDREWPSRSALSISVQCDS